MAEHQTELDLGAQEKGIEISDQQIENSKPASYNAHDWLGAWIFTRDTPDRPTQVNQPGALS